MGDVGLTCKLVASTSQGVVIIVEVSAMCGQVQEVALR